MTTPDLDASGGPGPAPAEPQDDPLPLRILGPFVDWVARRNTSVHIKLLAGFMLIAVLLLALGLFSIAVLGRVDRQVETLTALHEQTELAQDMIYGVTAQSHFRAMSLITQIDSWDAKIYKAKEKFDDNLIAVRAIGIPAQPAFFDEMEANNSRFESESIAVSDLVRANAIDEAFELHIQVEHETSHELEGQLNQLIADSAQLAAVEELNFQSDRNLLTLAVAGFSVVTLGAALFLGAVMSWSLIRPVRKVDEALRLIADGDFEQRVTVHNRDEFGSLTANLNKTTEQLGSLYAVLVTLNAVLQESGEMKVDVLLRADRLRR
jgi:methyl-accepting chemotaxis protein